MGTRYDIEVEFRKLDEQIRDLRELLSTIRKLNPEIVNEAEEVLKNKKRKKKVKKGVCERCGTTVNVAWCPNPYLNEIENKTVYEWLCDSCYDEIADDI